MSISNISGNTNTYAKDANPLSLGEAIKAYQDEMLTGLTDDEKAEIERLSKEYLDKNPVKTKQDRDVFDSFVKSLLKKYGFKGDIDEYAVGFADEMQSIFENAERQPESSNIMERYQMAAQSAMPVKNMFLS